MSRVSSSMDCTAADAVIMPLRRRRSILACHEERRRFSLKITRTHSHFLYLLYYVDGDGDGLKCDLARDGEL